MDPLWLQSIGLTTTIVEVKSTPTRDELRHDRRAANAAAPENGGPFHSGAVVLVTLNNPREKFWGVLLALNTAGISVQGIELAAFEDATSAVVAGEALASNALFFPMHRVERIQLDLPEGAIPSLSQRFQARTGRAPIEVLLQSSAAVHEGE
jgi:hypothetical protein